MPSTLPKNHLDQEKSIVILCVGDFFSHGIVASIDLSLCILNLPQKTVNKFNNKLDHYVNEYHRKMVKEMKKIEKNARLFLKCAF